MKTVDQTCADTRVTRHGKPHRAVTMHFASYCGINGIYQRPIFPEGTQQQQQRIQQVIVIYVVSIVDSSSPRVRSNDVQQTSMHHNYPSPRSRSEITAHLQLSNIGPRQWLNMATSKMMSSIQLMGNEMTRSPLRLHNGRHRSQDIAKRRVCTTAPCNQHQLGEASQRQVYA
eukprot:scpid15057/ scgid7276/ 